MLPQNNACALEVWTQIRRPYLIGVLALIATFTILNFVYKNNRQPGAYKSNDIQFIWSDGHEIAHGVNPYSKIHGSDMLKNKGKYSTYLPGFYLITAAYVKLGHATFAEWMEFWRPTGFYIHFAIGTLLFFALMPLGGFWLSIFGSQFWLLARWPIGIMNSGQIDGLAILFLLIAMLFLKKYPRLALTVFGLSLSVKQIGVFMLPILLLSQFDCTKSLSINLKAGLTNLCYVLIIPLLICLPFVIWDFKGLIMSLLFSATRSPGGHLKIPSIDELLGYVGLFAKIPMLLMMAMVYMLFIERRIGLFSSALVLYLCFMSFNSVLFKQYMPWFCAFLGLAISELSRLRHENLVIGKSPGN